MRYVLAAPVENGIAFWEISDLVRDYPVVTIWKDLPNAAEIARQILFRLNGDFTNG